MTLICGDNDTTECSSSYRYDKNNLLQQLQLLSVVLDLPLSALIGHQGAPSSALFGPSGQRQLCTVIPTESVRLMMMWVDRAIACGYSLLPTAVCVDTAPEPSCLAQKFKASRLHGVHRCSAVGRGCWRAVLSKKLFCYGWRRLHEAR